MRRRKPKGRVGCGYSSGVYEIRPHLMFFGEAQAAIDLYTSTFQGARVASIATHAADGPGVAGTVARATLVLGAQELVVIDSPPVHDFSFTPAMSLLVEFDTPAELDSVFAKLAEGGRVLMPLAAYPFSKRFGWLQDRFGVSWQLACG
jgi:predicted 3-demethylubiquinone-9 3-methyltransferase (glyoxalase superfamily)